MTSHGGGSEQSRRQFLTHCALASGALALSGLAAGCASGAAYRSAPRQLKQVAGREIDLCIANSKVRIAGQATHATTINGSVPGPLVRLREGEPALLRVKNELAVSSSIHWHGIILPPEMDGVPGVSFDGIDPGETFDYRFTPRQSGTYWYHSHSGLQEQTGIYGAMVIDPAEPEPYSYDRELVVVLSDWTFEEPERVLARLKKYEGYYNFQRRTLANLPDEARRVGFWKALSSRLAWDRMRMDATDLLDVTSVTYTHLMNGLSPDENWTGFFRPGERVRLRIINASSATYFDVRIPGLPMTVVQADGANILPVETDELRIAIAETYDVIVTPEDRPYTLFAETMDRSGYACGTLAARAGQRAELPTRRQRPLLTMMDMGMSMQMGKGKGHGEAAHASQANAGPVALEAQVPVDPMHGMAAPRPWAVPEGCKAGVPVRFNHGKKDHGPGNITNAEVAESRLHDPGMGLRNAQWRVLTYADLRRFDLGGEEPPVGREIELHLTGNMERYMWSFDGVEYRDDMPPIRLKRGERVRVVLINDTMMSHPIHLHGMYVELEVGACARNPLKHTFDVKPAQRLSWLLSAREVGSWAFHCHILYHMNAGMFRVVEITP